jgi:RHS repeat-associated protein
VASGYAQTGEWLSTSSFGRDFRFGWSSAGRLESVASSYTVTNLGLDAYGRPASVRTGFAGASGFFGPYASHELAYDEMDRISRITASGPSVASTQTFGYDLADRLTSWTRDGAQTTYGYDPSGNMTGVNAAGTQTTLAYNVDDQLTTSTVGPVVTTYGNDVLGRRISQRSQTSTMTTTYGYNAMGKLSSFAAPGVSASYLYGATGMREVKVVTRGSAAATTSVLWSGNKPVVEQDGDGTILRYLYGPGGMPLSVQVTRSGSTSTYHYLTDGLGSVSSLVSETGTVAATYTYDPWGTVTSVGGADTWLASRQPLRYRAYYLDAESGLYYLPARYYDPKTCRFLSADPAAPSAGSPQSLNRYAYCEDDPIGMTDPSGAVLVEFYRQDERSRIGEIALVEARIQHAGSGGLKHAGKAVQDAALRSAMAREVAVAFAIGTPRPAYSLPRSIGDGTPYGRGNLRIGELSPPGYVDYGLAVVGTALDLRGGLPGVVVGIGVDAAAGFAYYIPRQLSGEGTFGDTVLGFAGMIPGVSEAMAIIYAYDALTRALGGAGISWTQPDN